MANAEQGERLDHLVERFRGQREQIRAALEYLKQRDPNRWANVCDKLSAILQRSVRPIDWS